MKKINSRNPFLAGINCCMCIRQLSGALLFAQWNQREKKFNTENEKIWIERETFTFTILKKIKTFLQFDLRFWKNIFVSGRFEDVGIVVMSFGKKVKKNERKTIFSNVVGGISKAIWATIKFLTWY